MRLKEVTKHKLNAQSCLSHQNKYLISVKRYISSEEIDMSRVLFLKKPFRDTFPHYIWEYTSLA